MPKAVPCAANPDLWFSDSYGLQLQAQRICLGCPVRAMCAELGEGEEFGVFGGVLPGERHSRRRERERFTVDVQKARARQMKTDGATVAHIARTLHRPRSTVTVWLSSNVA